MVGDSRVVSDDLVDEARRLLDQPASGRAFRSFRKSEVGWSGLKTDLSDRLGNVATPTLLVHGERDRVVPVEWAGRAHERLPDSELRVLRGCGHWPPRECPDTSGSGRVASTRKGSGRVTAASENGNLEVKRWS